jgi:hypothetical protein
LKLNEIEGKRKQEQVTVKVELIEANKNGFAFTNKRQRRKILPFGVREVDGGCDISLVF